MTQISKTGLTKEVLERKLRRLETYIIKKDRIIQDLVKENEALKRLI